MKNVFFALMLLLMSWPMMAQEEEEVNSDTIKSAVENQTLTLNQSDVVFRSEKSTQVCIKEGNILVRGQWFSLPDIEALAVEGFKVAQIIEKVAPQNQPIPCDPTLYPWDCGEGTCTGLPLTGHIYKDYRPSLIYSGYCLVRECQSRLENPGPGVCTQCSPWSGPVYCP